MKKFIVFVIMLVVTASLGVTVYYFMRDNEELVVDVNSYMYKNQGEYFEIDAELKNAKIGNEVVITSLNKSVVDWDMGLNAFEALDGGVAIIEIKTKRNTQEPIYIEVSVGNGTKETPYFIDSEEDLLSIGSNQDGNIFKNSKHYVLMQDITITNAITPILNNEEFTGSLDGNGYSIKNLKIETNSEIHNAGLFSILGSTGVVTNVTFTGVSINGEFETAGTVAGLNKGTISRCEITSGEVCSTKSNSNVGAVCGINQFSISSFGRVDRVASFISVSGTLNIGGLVGKNEGGIVINSYVYAKNSQIKTLANGSNIGGLIGLNIVYIDEGEKVTKAAVVKNCYAVATIVFGNNTNSNIASIIGYNDEYSQDTPNYIMGVYTNDATLNTVNNEFSLSAQATHTEKSNFRGVYSAFPKKAGTNKIDSQSMLSYVSIKNTNNTNDVNWDFVNVWLIADDVNDGYPYLNKNGADVPDELGTISDPTQISTQQALIDFMEAVNNGTAGTYYRLGADVTLDNSTAFMPIGSSAHPFTGTFDGNGYKISNVVISSSIISQLGDYKFAGLFGKITSNAEIKNLTVENISIKDGATYAGGIVGYNEGSIKNCKVISNACNKTSENISSSYISGGIAGINLGTIDSCKVVNQTVATFSQENKMSYCGGIAGVNGIESGVKIATIKDSSVVTSCICDKRSYTTYPDDSYVFDWRKEMNSIKNYVGGIAGANYYLITKNYVYNSDIESNPYNTFSCAAGVVGISKAVNLLKEEKAEVTYNKVLKGTISAHTGAGLIGNQYGIVEYNHVEMDNIRGLMITGLVNRLALDSRLRNCFSNSYLSSGEIKEYTCAAGMVGVIEYSVAITQRWVWKIDETESYGKVSQVLSACTFENGLGRPRYDALTYYRQESVVVYTTRKTGYGNDLIWEETGNATYDNNPGDIFGDTRQNNIKWFSHEELILNSQDVVSCFSSYGFDMTVWQFDAVANYPYIQGLPEIVEAE